MERNWKFRLFCVFFRFVVGAGLAPALHKGDRKSRPYTFDIPGHAPLNSNLRLYLHPIPLLQPDQENHPPETQLDAHRQPHPVQTH